MLGERLGADWVTPTEEEVNELYYITMGEQAMKRHNDARLFGTIQVPNHVPLTLTDLYYYINYETHNLTAPPSPKEKWVAVTCAFIRHSPAYKPCFGDKVVKGGKLVGECGVCRVGDWCAELKVHLIENPISKRFFPDVPSDNPIFMG